MADSSKRGVKRERKKITESERKRRKLHRTKDVLKTRIYLGSEATRWNALKEEHALKTDREVATFLIDSYRHTQTVRQYETATTVPVAGTSRMSSTPVHLESQSQVMRTPSISEVSSRESSDREKKDISGVEPLVSSAESEIMPIPQEVRKPTVSRPGAKKVSSSFVDPFEISIDVSHFLEDEDDDICEDPDYEPSLLMTSVLPAEVDLNSEDVAYEEMEFGLETVDPDIVEEDVSDSEDIAGVTVVKTVEECENLCGETKCVAFVSQLKLLSKISITSCATCGSKEIEIEENYVGSALYFKWVCKDGHVSAKWCSQPLLNRRMHSGDFLICSTILTSGNNFSKLSLWASMVHLKFPSAKQFHGIQGKYLVPTIDSYWMRHQAENLNLLTDEEIVVLGDGRNDTPGHCAQYCSYTLMEQDTKKILTLKTLDKRMTDRKSGNMEKAGFVAAMEELRGRNVSIVEVVTDAHLGIGAVMKSDYTDVKHSHDIWHAAKNLGKKLTKVAQKKGNKLLLKWITDIVNHFWFTCKTATNYKQFVGIWFSVLHHIVNEHEWMLPHSDDGVYHCLHGQLSNEERPWLDKKQHKDLLKDLASVIMDKRFLGKVLYYLNFRSTADLEGFHQHILMYCAKRYSYTPPVYRVRNLLAAIDHNMHVSRSVVLNKDGSVRLQRVWNKKSGRWNVYPVKEKKNYEYIDGLLVEALLERMNDKEGIYRARELEEEDPRRLSKHLAPISPKPTTDIYKEQQSRFK